MIDINAVNKIAESLVQSRSYERALFLYLFLCDDDLTFDGGYYAERIGFCYENLQRFYEARYWYRMAFLANPEIQIYGDAVRRLDNVNINMLLENSDISNI